MSPSSDHWRRECDRSIDRSRRRRVTESPARPGLWDWVLLILFFLAIAAGIAIAVLVVTHLYLHF